jgi:hypothetical protein
VTDRYIASLLSKMSMTIEESLLFQVDGFEYWQSTVVDKDRFPLASGMANNREQARRIACAEFIERTTYFDLKKEDFATITKWGLDVHPTACGFAAGFDSTNVAHRSICEALERWVMSLWIDDHYYIEKLNEAKINDSVDPFSRFLVSHFDRIEYYLKTVIVPFDSMFLQIQVGQTLGIKGKGVFPGSSAQIGDGNIWQHALLESYRHLMAVKNNPIQGNQFPENRVRYFAENAETAFKAVNRAHKKDWPLPAVSVHQLMQVSGENIFVARTIFNGWKSWSEGPLDRFLY